MASPWFCSQELNLCSQAVAELHLLAGDTIFNTTSKVQGPATTGMIIPRTTELFRVDEWL